MGVMIEREADRPVGRVCSDIRPGRGRPPDGPRVSGSSVHRPLADLDCDVCLAHLGFKKTGGQDHRGQSDNNPRCSCRRRGLFLGQEPSDGCEQL